MAATIAEATGIDKARQKYTHRLGSEAAYVKASTWHTFARLYVNRDGSGSVEVKQNGTILHQFEWGPE
jgi:hypothetical protein